MSAEAGPPAGPPTGPPMGPPMELILVFETPIWGMVTSLGLFGIIVNQAWTYATRNRDGWLLRSLVAAIMAMDFATVVICFSVVRYDLFENYGNPAALVQIPGYFVSHTFLLATIVFCVQCYFAATVFILNQRKWLIPGFIVLTGLGGLIGAYMVAVGDIQHPDFSFPSKTRKLELGAFNVLSVVCDLTSTLALTSQLWGSEGVKSTQAVVAQILRNIVTRGVVVTLAQIANLTLTFSMGTSLAPLALFYCLDKIYVITLLAMLNARQELKAKLESTAHLSLSTLRGTNPHRVNVTTETSYSDTKGERSQQSQMKFRETESQV